MALTLEDIAQLAGVSRATVSRVVNNYPYISPEVRERVMRVVREHNYRPHPAARTLVTRRTQAIGLFVPEGVMRLFADAFFPLLIQGIAEACNRLGYYITLIIETGFNDRVAFYRRMLEGQTIDGIITTSPPIGDPLLPMIMESGVPAVSVGRQPHFPGLPFADVDNRLGALQAVRHLVEHGHRRIATITGPLNTVTGLDRLEGYRDGLEEAGLEYDPNLVAEGDFTEPSGYAAMQELMFNQPSAVFVASDKMAMGAMRAIGDNGLRAGDDVSLVGFDNFPVSPGVPPQFTTVAQPAGELGSAAAHLLIDILNQRNEHNRRNGRAEPVEEDVGATVIPHVLLPTQLIERDTVRQVDIAPLGATSM